MTISKPSTFLGADIAKKQKQKNNAVNIINRRVYHHLKELARRGPRKTKLSQLLIQFSLSLDPKMVHFEKLVVL